MLLICHVCVCVCFRVSQEMRYLPLFVAVVNVSCVRLCVFRCVTGNALGPTSRESIFTLSVTCIRCLAVLSLCLWLLLKCGVCASASVNVSECHRKCAISHLKRVNLRSLRYLYLHSLPCRSLPVFVAVANCGVCASVCVLVCHRRGKSAI
jgi:hypothetical protein